MADEIPFRKEMNFEYGVPRELIPGLVRVVANNPSPFTFKGTNTYILGQGRDVAVLDPGPEDEAHFEAIMRAVKGKRVAAILVTHTHRDHVDGLPRLKAATGAPTWGYGRKALNPGVVKKSPNGGEYTDEDFVPDHPLADGGRFEGEGYALTALHTPGHAPDHLCFAIDGTGALLSGDHVMGWNTSVVAPPEGNMFAYMASLDKLMGREDKVFFPGHGGRIEQPQRVVKAFIVHRRMREQAILDCIRGGATTITEVVASVYRGLDPRLVKAASLSVTAHVESLVERGLVVVSGPILQPDRLSPA
ncbi:MAG: MBL fold metallo-hydrolase [Hyphomicrobiaceae bacterium]|nr:MBL fold metallo-hydrolase [Hyphomicrobiaceae bacterium]